MTVTEKLRDKANSLPLQPGVYVMKNSDGEVIYVGKSKKLKNRVTSVTELLLQESIRG